MVDGEGVALKCGEVGGGVINKNILKQGVRDKSCS